jgi:hypothetical protein
VEVIDPHQFIQIERCGMNRYYQFWICIYWICWRSQRVSHQPSTINQRRISMSGGYISFFNNSSVFSDAELASALPDFQDQVSNEFNWYWGLNAYLDVSGGGTPIIIVDYPGANDPQGALGYHFIDGNYQPYAVIFAGLCKDNGYPITGVISHELLEMMADQLVDTVNLYDNGDGTGYVVIQEVCDPCEMNVYYEGANGNIVSDFALPAWWVPGDTNQVDFLGVIPGPWQLASGGYISYQSITLSGWQQVFGEKVKQDMDKAATTIRSRISANGNPRTDVVRQLHQQSVQAGQQQFKGAPAPFAQRTPVFGPQQLAQQQSQINLARRVQPAAPAGQLIVVKRGDVPQVGAPGAFQQYGAGIRSQTGDSHATAGSRDGSPQQASPVPTGGPKAQTLPKFH